MCLLCSAIRSEKQDLFLHHLFHGFDLVWDQFAQELLTVFQTRFHADFTGAIQVGEDVDLANAAFCGFQKVTVRKAAAAMQHQRKSGFLRNFRDAGEVQFGREFVIPVGIADGHCQRVAAGALDKVQRRVRIGIIIRRIIKFIRAFSF